MLKKCTKCGQVKDLKEFYKDKQNRDGLKSYCKECKRDYYIKWSEKCKGVKEHTLRPPCVCVCTICGKAFQQRTSLQVTCGGERCKKARRNQTDRLLKASIRSHYGIACAICGGMFNLEIDHKYGYGKEHRIEIGINPHDSFAFYRWLRDNGYPSDYTVNGVTYKDGFRVLCKKCNNRQPRKARYSHFAMAAVT